MTGGWSVAALAIMATAAAARALVALWRQNRWLKSVERLAEMVRPGQRITCRDADGAVVEITSGRETARRMESAREDSAKATGCDISC